MATPLTPTSDSDRTDVVDPRDAAWIKLTQFDWEGTRSGADSATRVSVSALVGSVFRPAQGPHELGRLANFRILDILGQGGMGLVFRAEDVQLQREVALKILLPASMRDPQARERFLREARAAAGLSHDHVVAIHQVGEDQGVLFLAMSLLRGQSLEEWQRRQGPASWPRVFRLGRELLSGLAAAHAQGLVHRDVKPGNLWLEEPRGRLKILDFGLAWNASAMASTTQEGVRVGTPEYMSPEQMGGSPVDARSDLFAAGLVLHRLATGRLPFAGKTLFERMAAMASQGSPSVREQRPDAPPELDQFIRKLLELEPERRPAHAGEALAEWVAIETGWLTRQQELGTSAESLRQAAEVPVGAARPGVVPDPLPASTHESRSLHGPRRRVALLLGAAGIVAVLAILGFLTVPQWLADRASVASVTTPTPTSAEPAEAADEPAGRRRPRPGDGLPEQEARFERLGRCPDARVTEASALIASRRQAGLYWTLTDANNPPHVFALDLTGDLRGAYVLEGSVNVDWEAMTADRAGHLYIGDVGNNHMRQRTRVV
ncbi:MAG TPA: serine/threonine-protein kinase, partial [Gemmatales bacterium]|nr:serine/threonine-protein kinase [Gemmatales bacterium]